jgi:hypothetical protein
MLANVKKNDPILELFYLVRYNMQRLYYYLKLDSMIISNIYINFLIIYNVI